MHGNLKNRSGFGFLAGLSLFVISVGLGVPQASAQSTSATTAVSTTQTPTSPAKIKEPVTATDCKAAMKPGKPYFVEFRSRTAASYGHTFVFYGRLTVQGKFGKFEVAGLHPKGDDPGVYMMGHMVPVPAETGVSDGDLDEQYLTARYCVTLNEAEYNKVVAFIKNLQATSTTWHAPTYNCNSFAEDIAKSVGLKTPFSTVVYPEVFINQLREVNNGTAPSDMTYIPYVQWGLDPPKH